MERNSFSNLQRTWRVIAIDTNILVYAHRKEMSHHSKAFQCIQLLAEGRKDWAIPWSCLHEFFAVVTHHKIFNAPTPHQKAIEQINHWMESPSLHLIHEGGGYWDILSKIIESGKIIGGMTHDARIAAICIQNDIDVLWSADRDFSRISNLTIENPLLK